MKLSMYYNIEVDHDRKLVISKIYGIWKEETARNYHEEYKETVRLLLKGRWARLTHLTNWKSSYPEIIEVIGDHMHWCYENGAAFSVFIIDNPVTTRQLKQMIAKAQAEDYAKLFKTAGEAEKFLREKGF
jgi:hypothetical protein